MPAMDGTGPRGAGARTGRGLGRCRTTDARRTGSGSGFGRGFRKGFGCAVGLGFGCCCFGLGMKRAMRRRKGVCGTNKAERGA